MPPTALPKFPSAETTHNDNDGSATPHEQQPWLAERAPLTRSRKSPRFREGVDALALLRICVVFLQFLGKSRARDGLAAVARNLLRTVLEVLESGNAGGGRAGNQ